MREQGFNQDALAQFERMPAELQQVRSTSNLIGGPEALATLLVQRSGVPAELWERGGQEMLEAVMPRQSGHVTDLFGDGPGAAMQAARTSARLLGLDAVTLVPDFPITTATFGFSRVDYQPGNCRLNPFPPDPDHQGRFPVFFELVEADALQLRLDHLLVLDWMRHNGLTPRLPQGSDPALSAQAYFVRLLDGVSVRQTVQDPEARYAFGLLHTFSHLALKRAALLSGLEGTSMSEYLLPRTLTCALYCNHRFGATIGALSGLFEQSLHEWLSEIRSVRRCIASLVQSFG